MGIYDSPVDPFAVLEPTAKRSNRRKTPAKPSSSAAEPSTGPTRSETATKVAQDFYDAVNGLVDFTKVRSVAVKALKGGYEGDAVLAAMKDAHRDGRPITAEVLHQYLEGYARRRVANPGMDKSIHYAADAQNDPSRYSEDL